MNIATLLVVVFGLYLATVFTNQVNPTSPNCQNIEYV